MAAAVLLKAAARALSAAFPGMTVYYDTPMQGAQEPYLLVRQTGLEQAPDGPGQYRRTYRIGVETHRGRDARAAAAPEIAERLLICLRKLDAEGGSVMAGGIACSMEERGEVLCVAEYSTRVAVGPAPGTEGALMRSLTYDREIKGV